LNPRPKNSIQGDYKLSRLIGSRRLRFNRQTLHLPAGGLFGPWAPCTGVHGAAPRFSWRPRSQRAGDALGRTWPRARGQGFHRLLTQPAEEPHRCGSHFCLLRI